MKLYIKEVIGNPVTDAEGKEIPFSPIGGDCGFLEIDETVPENAARVKELDALCGRFGIYAATEEQVAIKKSVPQWRPQVNPSKTPLREFQTNVQSQPPVVPVAVDRPAVAPVAPVQSQAQEPAVPGQPRVIRPNMPRETGFPNNNAPQMPATPPAPILGSEFKPKTGSPKRSQSKLPTETATANAPV